MNKENLLIDVRDLKVYFHIEQGIVRAVDGLSFDIKKGQSIGIVGESGCGKTVTALSLMLLHPQPVLVGAISTALHDLGGKPVLPDQRPLLHGRQNKENSPR